MPTGWMKTLQCKTNAVVDVAYTPTPSKKPLLATCFNSSNALKNVLFLFPRHSSSSLPKEPKPKATAKLPSPSAPATPSHSHLAADALIKLAHSHRFPTLTELLPDHWSRRVLEIIFSSCRSSHGGRGHGAVVSEFPGVIEMLFRVDNPTRTLARFEEYRTSVQARAARSGEAARSAADGNEIMRFQCCSGGGGGGGGGWSSSSCSLAWSAARGKVAGIRTFAGSGRANMSVAGGGSGRQAMLVCRVIAGRVRDEWDPESECDSMSLGKGELVVFDQRAVLPCFLIIYKHS